MEEKRYQGFTIDELRARYSITVSGNEKGMELNKKNATLIKYYQEISKFLTIVESKKDTLKYQLETIEDHIKSEELANFQSITSRDFMNKTKTTDAYRKALAFNIARPKDIMDKRDRLTQEYNDIMVEYNIWKRLLETIIFVSEKIDKNAITVNSELKAFNSKVNQIIKEETTEKPIETSIENKEFFEE